MKSYYVSVRGLSPFLFALEATDTVNYMWVDFKNNFQREGFLVSQFAFIVPVTLFKYYKNTYE